MKLATLTAALISKLTYERYALQQPEQNPLVREAAFIAQQLDNGNSAFAAERLREDLYQLQHSPDAQKQLVAMVEILDRKGAGADLQLSLSRQGGRAFADARVVDYQYGSSEMICRMVLGNDFGRANDFGRNNNHHAYRRDQSNYYARRQPAYQSRRAVTDYGHYGHDYTGYRTSGLSGLRPETASALARAQAMAARDGVQIEVTSGFRTHAQQAHLYRTLNTPVAKPGTSSHEFGEAIDVRNYAQAKPYLVAAGFVHGDGRGRIKGDPWHFRYMG